MKRRFLRVVVYTLILILLIGTVPASAASVIKVNDINIMVDNRIFQPTDANGRSVRVFEYNGTTYAPLRALAEAYGLNVGYSQKLRCAYVYEGEEPDLSGISAADADMVFPDTNGKIQLIVKPINIVVKGEIFKPTDANGKPVPVFETGGTTYAPLRALAEAYGLEVGYDAKQRLAYVTRPGDQQAFTKLPDGSTLIAAELEQPEIDGTLVQSPVAFFSLIREPGYVDSKEQTVDYISADMAQAYMDLLVSEFGYVLNDEDLSYVYNTWRFLKPGSGTDPGEYNIYNDVKVIHYYDSDWHDNTLEVSVNNKNFQFADLGYRYGGETISAYAGERAADSYVLKDGYYMNSSDKILSVAAGERDNSTYSYTKPYSSEFYTYTSVNGLCRLIVNGSELETHSALLCDFENFNSKENDMVLVWHDDGNDLLKLRWKKDTFKSGEAYNLNDIISDIYGDVDIDYNGKTYTIDSVNALTVRPLWLDRTGSTESLLYFYIEVDNGEGGIALTLEGLVAAPFNLAENSEHTSTHSGSSSSSGSSSGSPDPNVAEHSRLDCLTCRGDGDCNSCGGSGNDYFGGYRTKCTTCYGSGNCRSCGGSGKR